MKLINACLRLHWSQTTYIQAEQTYLYDVKVILDANMPIFILSDALCWPDDLWRLLRRDYARAHQGAERRYISSF